MMIERGLAVNCLDVRMSHEKEARHPPCVDGSHVWSPAMLP
jgi:hypothetical protein